MAKTQSSQYPSKECQWPPHSTKQKLFLIQQEKGMWQYLEEAFSNNQKRGQLVLDFEDNEEKVLKPTYANRKLQLLMC